VNRGSCRVAEVTEYQFCAKMLKINVYKCISVCGVAVLDVHDSRNNWNIYTEHTDGRSSLSMPYISVLFEDVKNNIFSSVNIS